VEPTGWLMLIVSWGIIMGVAAWAVVKVLRS
jgi:hypothetical protein